VSIALFKGRRHYTQQGCGQGDGKALALKVDPLVGS